MVQKVGGGIMHFKMMLFAGQNTVEFGSANYSPNAFVPVTPYSNYVSETIFFEDDPVIVNSFKTKVDNLWTDTTNYQPYANITSRVRAYPTYPISADMNFPPGQDFANRDVKLYNAETQKIDVAMFRVTDQRQSDGMIAAQKRGIPIRYIGETNEYRDPSRLWVAWNMDRMFAAGIPMRVRASEGENHDKLVLLYAQGLTIFGSSNWTSPSANSQQEHNYFTNKNWIFVWFQDQFDRKWNNSNPSGTAETEPFVPLGPDKPKNVSVANGAVGVATTAQKLKWYGGPWAHVYDVYFGTEPEPAAVCGGPGARTERDDFPEPELHAADAHRRHHLLLEDRVEDRREPHQDGRYVELHDGRSTAAAATAAAWRDNARAVGIEHTERKHSRQLDQDHGCDRVWRSGAVESQLGRVEDFAGARQPDELLRTDVYRIPRHRISPVGASASRIELAQQRFGERAVQRLHRFAGSPHWRIGSPSSAEVVLQAGSSDTSDSGWGWSDDGWDAPGMPIYFAADGVQTVRVQQREDGAIVDEIVLSPDTYLTAAPGVRDNDTTILPANDGSGSPPPPPPPPPSEPDVVLWTANVAPSAITGNWQTLGDATAAGGEAMWNPDAGQAKISPALASPSNFFEMTFNAKAGIALSLVDSDARAEQLVVERFSRLAVQRLGGLRRFADHADGDHRVCGSRACRMGPAVRPITAGDGPTTAGARPGSTSISPPLARTRYAYSSARMAPSSIRSS